jgi:hypothetical protein
LEWESIGAPSLSSAGLSCWTTSDSGLVRQLFASWHPSQRTSLDLGGLRWTDATVMETAAGTSLGGRSRSDSFGERRGEGFEPSIRLTTVNGFRDQYEGSRLQGFYSPCAVCAPADTVAVCRPSGVIPREAQNPRCRLVTTMKPLRVRGLRRPVIRSRRWKQWPVRVRLVPPSWLRVRIVPVVAASASD